MSNSCKSAVQAFILTACINQANFFVVYADDLASERNGSEVSEKQLLQRRFSPTLDGKWIGQGISYGPYREGQSPGGNLPTREQLNEDLNLISQHWNLIRMYGASEVAEDVLEIIREEKLPLRVMLGAWITRESESETVDAKAAKAGKLANRKEIMSVIRLSNEYPDEMIAINVGNETQVYWTDHLTQAEVLIRNIQAVRDATLVPVTTADDFNFWNKPESKKIAQKIDFIALHIHPMWAGVESSNALSWTKRIYAEICRNHPDMMVVISEAGWATQVHSEGEQAKLIKGKASERDQELYYRQFTNWARKNKICTFFFEAFDEPWKGGSHPNEVEKHWGVFDVNRQSKVALSSVGAK
ncbi:MAG: glycosyl hydrolase family 17 protein [Pirellulales bacterium]